MDCTIISICPFETIETKPLAMGYYKIPAAKMGDIEVLLVKDSYYNLPLAATIPPKAVRVPVYGEDIARSIIKDFCFTHVASEPNAYPGMMWVKSAVSKEKAKILYREEIENLHAIQTRWFENLVKSADDDWAQYRKHSLINLHQRYAAEALGITDREWCKSFNPNEGMIKCPACMTPISPEAAICNVCKCVVNAEKLKSLKFVEA